MGVFGEIPGSSTAELGVAKILHVAHLQNYCGCRDRDDGIDAQEYGSGRTFDPPKTLESGAELPNPGYFSPYKQFVDQVTTVVHAPSHIAYPASEMSLADAVIELDKQIGLAAGALAGMGLTIDLGDPSSWPEPEDVAGLVAAALATGTIVAGSADLIEGILALDAEIVKLDTWLGRAVGETAPAYSSSNYVGASSPIETAIGELDTNIFDEISDIDSFIGRGSGETAPNFTGTNYVLSDTDLEAAIITLDSQIATVEGDSASSGDLATLQTQVNGIGDQVADLESFTGGGDDTFYPQETSPNDLLDNAGGSITSLAAAIDKLAELLDAFMQDQSYTP